MAVMTMRAVNLALREEIAEQLTSLEETARQSIEAGVYFALASPFPATESVYEGTFAEA